jgi:hypothetical protein
LNYFYHFVNAEADPRVWYFSVVGNGLNDQILVTTPAGISLLWDKTPTPIIVGWLGSLLVKEKQTIWQKTY